MFDLLFIASIVGSAVQAIKEACAPTIHAENFANKELYHKDIINGVPVKQRMENIKNGKYKAVETYPEPHRNPQNGKIVIENYKLYYEDVNKYGAYQAQQWVNKGKYNLPLEELKKEEERIKKYYESLYKF